MPQKVRHGKLPCPTSVSSREIYSVRRKSSRRRPEPKYRDPETGATWSGRGRPPAWIDGKDRVPFEIDRHGAHS
ncbi:H-NS histone family protein [Burkholderia sp. LS-044]|nr:H-NS histone family protein [Burkholderia sp. LS-044]